MLFSSSVWALDARACHPLAVYRRRLELLLDLYVYQAPVPLNRRSKGEEFQGRRVERQENEGGQRERKRERERERERERDSCEDRRGSCVNITVTAHNGLF